MDTSLCAYMEERTISLLIEARERAGLSQREASARISASPNVVGYLERRVLRLSARYLLRLCCVYGVRPSVILRRAEEDTLSIAGG